MAVVHGPLQGRADDNPRLPGRADAEARRLVLNRRAMKAAACCGMGCVLLFFIGFGAVAQFIVPPSPRAGAVQIAARFHGHENRSALV